MRKPLAVMAVPLDHVFDRHGIGVGVISSLCNSRSENLELHMAHAFLILYFYQPLQLPWNQGLHLICRNPTGDKGWLTLVF
jgi:hypothetical protein